MDVGEHGESPEADESKSQRDLKLKNLKCDENYDDNEDSEDKINDDYEDASEESDGKKLATLPLGTKLTADNLIIPIWIDVEIYEYFIYEESSYVKY